MRILLGTCLVLFFSVSAFAAPDHGMMVQEAMNDLGIPPAEEFQRRLEAKDPMMTVGVAARYLGQQQCSKARYWLEAVKAKDGIEYDDLAGLMYLNGDCVPQDIRYAQILFKRSASKSYWCKEHLLSAYLVDPYCNPKDTFVLARELASYGNELGIYTVAGCYAQGTGTIRNFEKAYMWSLVGMSLVRHPEQRRIYHEMANALEALLTEAQCNRQRMRAESWKPQRIPNSLSTRSVNTSYGINPAIYASQPIEAGRTESLE